ncbi:hypothetical protein [Enterococcus gilvus]
MKRRVQGIGLDRELRELRRSSSDSLEDGLGAIVFTRHGNARYSSS